MEGERDSVGLSWRVQAFLWPAVCSTVTLVVLGGYAIARNGLRYSPGIAASVAWVIVVVPIIVLVCSLVLGGVAAAAAGLVRAGFGAVRPRASSVSRTVVLAVATGAGVAGVVIGFFALLRQSWAVGRRAVRVRGDHRCRCVVRISALRPCSLLRACKRTGTRCGVRKAEVGSMSWRAQALLWPGVCALVYVAVLAWRSSASWDWGVLAVVAPIAAAGCAFVFGGIAIATALFVRLLLRSVWPDSPLIVQRSVVAAATGTMLFTFWLAMWAAGAGAVPTDLWLHAAVVGSIAAFASALYTHSLFDDPVDDDGMMSGPLSGE